MIIDGDDIYGDGVKIAARLEALAEPGGTCISRVVRDQIRDKLPYPFADMGEQTVKNIARPVGVFAMNANAVALTPLAAAPAPLGPGQKPAAAAHSGERHCRILRCSRGLLGMAQRKCSDRRGARDDGGR